MGLKRKAYDKPAKTTKQSSDFSLNEKDVILWAAFSRVMVLVIARLVSRIGTDYDTSAELSFTDHDPARDMSIAEVLPFIRWDSIYFLAISQREYVYEHEHAFFPGYPMLNRILAFVMTGSGKTPSALVFGVAGVIVSNAAFLFAAIFLYRLSLMVLKHKGIAGVSAILFCLNPASIFMSSMYSESLFAAFAFMGMMQLESKKPVRATFAWILASTVRSNGILYGGFLGLHALTSYFTSNGPFFEILRSIPLAAFVFASFAYVQWQGYEAFCLIEPTRPWCNNMPPLIYSFVQDKYWNVGFMRYWTIQQLPNFILAAPMLLLAFFGAKSYIASLLGGIRTGDVGFLGKPVLPYILLWIILTFHLSFFAHIQIITRVMCSSMPCMYWYAAHLVLHNPKNIGKIVCGYFIGYGLVGIVLFSKFLPPA
ncbi:GPI mannosyltransferase 2 [Chytridium lagenaria]|nr:GPI mannosyltransferase 2 [Chytridium lagenaria]